MISVIVPFCNEFPQVIFTIRALAEELVNRTDFEIIAVNNYCEQVKKQGREEDKGFASLQAASQVNPWLKVLKYDKELSHWQSKNFGIKNSQGGFLFFADAHVSPARDSIFPMYQFYKQNHEELNGTIHLPLTYQILDNRKLVYEPKIDLSIAKFSYRFKTYQHFDRPFQVPCMSTCGMMITREKMQKLGYWPNSLGIYGGGEPFINYTSATMGWKRWIWNGNALHHFGEKRGYSYNYTNWVHNETVACFFIGGEKCAERFIANVRGTRVVLDAILAGILSNRETILQKSLIDEQRTMTIEDWWEAQPK